MFKKLSMRRGVAANKDTFATPRNQYAECRGVVPWQVDIFVILAVRLRGHRRIAALLLEMGWLAAWVIGPPDDTKEWRSRHPMTIPRPLAFLVFRVGKGT